MWYVRRQVGFSLIEVMFAVVILMLGLIFVASFFPVGLRMSKQVADATQGGIDYHNTTQMMRLRLERLVAKGDWLGSGKFLDNSDGQVRLLYQPNVRIGSVVDIVMDDPCGAVFENRPNETPALYDPCYMPDYIPLDEAGATSADPCLMIEGSAIGAFVLPMVGETDEGVLEGAQALKKLVSGVAYDPTDPDDRHDYLHPTLYKMALERKRSLLTFAQCLDPNQDGGDGRTFRFFIFTLNCRDKKLRYGFQDSDLSANPQPKLHDADQDRLFPTAWRVELDSTKPTLLNPMNFADGDKKDRFVLTDYTVDAGAADRIAALLREGMPIIDVDNGYRYEIVEIIEEPPDGTPGKWLIKLDRDLEEVDHFGFWLVPPAIERDGSDYTFGEEHPVVEVREVVISF